MKIRKISRCRSRSPKYVKLSRFTFIVVQRTAKKCTEIYNARAQTLFYSFNLSFWWRSLCRCDLLKLSIDEETPDYTNNKALKQDGSYRKKNAADKLQNSSSMRKLRMLILTVILTEVSFLCSASVCTMNSRQ